MGVFKSNAHPWKLELQSRQAVNPPPLREETQVMLQRDTVTSSDMQQLLSPDPSPDTIHSGLPKRI